jgi:hypothetical protein
MLTGIYVSASTTITFTSSEAVVLVPYDSTKSSITASGSPLQATVPQGIYKVETNDSINCTCPASPQASSFESPNVKDPIPTPPAFAHAMYNDDMSSLGAFFLRPEGRSISFPTSAHAHAR